MKYNRFDLQKTLQAMEEVYQEKGFVTHALVGQKVGLSRQSVQINLTKAVERGALSADYMAKFAHIPRNDTVRQHISISKETSDFMHNLARELRVRPSAIMETALEMYRDKLASSLPGSTHRPSAPS